MVRAEMISTRRKERLHTSKFLCSDICFSNDAIPIVPSTRPNHGSPTCAFCCKFFSVNNTSVKVLRSAGKPPGRLFETRAG
ncbi:hypothetical protein FIBSPDRAFT_863894 [Athelia psychrophila]|uniref:Uncharacterized protein n=1 Tax=Athelia psychrophila TaxID=1759441 RepID=A0A166H249_9AGAM|nr:hypothetical protein FIBSPDRAFT_863894 [Fibularhizoctonia sp. CBS 109695]